MNEYMVYLGIGIVGLLVLVVVAIFVWNRFFKRVKTKFIISDYKGGKVRLSVGGRPGKWHSGNGDHTDTFRAHLFEKHKRDARLKADEDFRGGVEIIPHP